MGSRKGIKSPRYPDKDAITTIEFFNIEYIEKRRSVSNIAKQLGVSPHYIINRLDMLGIKKRNVWESRHPDYAVSNDKEKYCPRCKRNLPVEKFYVSHSGKTRWQSWCIECGKNKRIEYFLKHPDKNKLEIQKRKATLILEFGNKCCICGAENLPTSCYSFHHKNPEEKEYSPASSQYSNEKILKEIREKCVLVCLHCHAVLHTNDKRVTDILSEIKEK